MRATASNEIVNAVLDSYGEITRAALADYLPSRKPRRHLYDLLADYPQRGGKMMRPALCMATVRAFGGRVDDAVQSAVAIEMLHNALLIHDDIEDESDERRGKPAMHVMHGVPMAINVGDMLTLMSLRPLIENATTIGPRVAMRILEETERMARETAEGQAMELGWRRDNVNELEESDYLVMVLKKTCWLATIHPCRVGALIATSDGADLDALFRFGFFLGAAFQIQDDILNLEGDERYGKEIGGDIWEGKRTLMLIQLMREATPVERERVAGVLGTTRERRAAKDVAWIRGLMDRYGSIEHARNVTHGLAGAALNEFDLVFGRLPDSQDKEFIRALATWVFERHH